MVPVVIKEIAPLRQQLAEVRQRGQQIGLVPTMGALHAGHVSLLDAARRENDWVVASLFVNPTQFGPHEDLDRYPRPFERDLAICGEHGVNLLFAPPTEVMYPQGFCTSVEVSGTQDILEGASRPGHFRGVATVVLKLLLIVLPDRVYFGQKDAQQVHIVQQMVHDLNVPTSVHIQPTIREADGLALSSRNQYLDPDQRQQATVLHRALEAARKAILGGERDTNRIRQLMEVRIASAPLARIDYAEVVNPQTFQPLMGQLPEEILLVLAVRFGETRLIDNWPIVVPRTSP